MLPVQFVQNSWFLLVIPSEYDRQTVPGLGSSQNAPKSTDMIVIFLNFCTKAIGAPPQTTVYAITPHCKTVASPLWVGGPACRCVVWLTGDTDQTLDDGSRLVAARRNLVLRKLACNTHTMQHILSFLLWPAFFLSSCLLIGPRCAEENLWHCRIYTVYRDEMPLPSSSNLSADNNNITAYVLVARDLSSHVSVRPWQKKYMSPAHRPPTPRNSPIRWKFRPRRTKKSNVRGSKIDICWPNMGSKFQIK